MESGITGWWGSISSFDRILWIVAIFFTVLFLIQTIFTFAVGDGEDAIGDSDLSIGEDHGAGSQFLTFKNIVAFFTMFSWTALAMLGAGYGHAAALIVGAIAGSAMVALMVFMFSRMAKLASSGTLEFQNAVGKTAEVYLPIPAKRKSIGKVQIHVQGQLLELRAVTDDENDIATGRVVTVKEIINNSILLVTAE